MLYIFKIECLIPIRYFDIINNAYFLRIIILLIFLGDKSRYKTCFIRTLYTIEYLYTRLSVIVKIVLFFI